MRDLYHREARILSAKKKFKEICPICCELVEKFETQLNLNNYSIGRIEKYWSFLKSIHKNLDVCFNEVKKEDLERFVIFTGNNGEWSENTKKDFKIIVKFFFRWLINDALEGDYPKLVSWIKVRMKKNNEEVPAQVLTKDEIELLSNSTNNLRDKAFVRILYESGCRISEFLGIRIKDISFDQYGSLILVSGKTGWRRIRIIEYSKDLFNWMDIHPLKANPDSYVWLNLETLQDVISPAEANKILKKLAKKCNITKPVHPHFFRHSRATYLFKFLSDAVIKEIFGWTKDSRMASIYNHLSGKDVDEALLKMYGINIK
jgi:site-specific recombinase XerD